MAYGTIIQLCVLALLAKGMDTYRWQIYWPALFAVTTPVALAFATGWIVGQANWQLISPSNLTLLLFQYLAALIVFNFLKLYEDTIAAWLMILLGGGMLIYMIIPALVGLFL